MGVSLGHSSLGLFLQGSCLPFLLLLVPCLAAVTWVMGPPWGLVLAPLVSATAGLMLPSACEAATKTQQEAWFCPLRDAAWSPLHWTWTLRAKEASHELSRIIPTRRQSRRHRADITVGVTKALHRRNRTHLPAPDPGLWVNRSCYRMSVL